MNLESEAEPSLLGGLRGMLTKSDLMIGDENEDASR